MAIFSASVALAVKATFSGPGHPNRRESLHRVSKTVPAASRELSWVPRELLPMVLMARKTASATEGGLWTVVAALSK